VLTHSSVIRSAATRAFFLASAAISLGILWWANAISYQYHGPALSGSYYYLFSVFDQTAASGLLVILIVAVFIARPGWLHGVVTGVSEHVNVIASLTVVALSAACIFVYDNHPLSMDEYSAYFQSHVFAAGHLSGHFPPALLDYLVPPGFQNYFLHISRTTGAVAAGYWPSFSLLLTPFTWLGIPWACNPIISGLTLLAMHRLALRLFADREAAGFAVLLTLASPVFFADGISYYSMPAHLLANCLYALLLLSPTPRRALLAGVVGSVALTLHNPVPHLLFAVPWFLWIARQPNGGRLLACLCAGYLPLCLLLGIGWFEFLNSMHNADTVSAASSHGSGPHTFIDSLDNLLASVFSLPTLDVFNARAIGLAKVWAWAVPGLMILAGAGAWKLRRDPRCRLFAASATVTLLGYLLVPVDQGHGWGFRYFHSAWMVLPLLAAGVLTRSRELPDTNNPFASEDMRTFVAACALLCLVIGNVQRAQQIHQFIAEDLYNLPRYEKNVRQILFINPNAFYTKDLVQNDPWLRGDRILMMSHGSSQDKSLMHDQFPQMRRVVEGPHGSVWVNGSDDVAQRQP
jgi:hypothetical protein